MLAARRCEPRVVGHVITRWLDDDVHMKLTTSVGFIDQWCTLWEARKGTIIDGASFRILLIIPFIGWLTRVIVGGDPYDGPYRIGAVLHDADYQRLRRKLLYRERLHARLRLRDIIGIHFEKLRADRMFYDFAVFRRMTRWRADVMWTALRWFSWAALLQQEEAA